MVAPLMIEYTPDRKDYILASRALAKKSTGFIIIAGLIILTMIAAAVVLIFPSVGDPAWNNAAVVALLVSAFYIFYLLVLIPLQLSRTYKTNDYLQLERKLTFTESGVTMRVGDQTTDLLWDNFKEVIDGGGFYLLIYEGENRVYPFIPERAFTTGASEEALLAILAGKGIPLR
jgi:hypothetical protein